MRSHYIVIVKRKSSAKGTGKFEEIGEQMEKAMRDLKRKDAKSNQLSCDSETMLFQAACCSLLNHLL